MEAHSKLHREAVRLASDLRFLAQQRWSNALAYQATRDSSYLAQHRKSETETQGKLDTLKKLFKPEDVHFNESIAYQADGMLESYRIIRTGHFELYGEFFEAVERGDLKHQDKLITLLHAKVRLVRATLDDLMVFHVKVEQSVETRQRAMEQQANLVFFGLLGVLMLAGLGFSWFQTRSIVRPLTGLTFAARKVGAGETADLARFKGKGEIGELSDALTQMVGTLQQSHREISAQKDQLALAYAEVEEMVRQRTATLMRRTEELEVANQDLEGFSYSISHDLRAPLRAIDGFIAILREDYGNKLDAEGLRLFGVVSDNARKMGQLIDDILTFSRAGRLELEQAAVDMNALVGEVWADLVALRAERLIEFQCSHLPMISGDSRALRQVWQNLLDNALKFSRGRAPARIEVSAEQMGDVYWFTVTDNGVGFNATYADKLFGLFQRLHGMDEFEGTGVGLAIVKRYVRKHGGQVSATGTVGGGATFRFGLPMSPVLALTEKGE
jgi:signal transduction histidine kinase